MAHKKGQGSSRNGRDSHGQRQGIKVYEGELVRAGSILVRQHANKFRAGRNTARGRDYTVYAVADGVVQYEGNGRVSVNPVAPESTEKPSKN